MMILWSFLELISSAAMFGSRNQKWWMFLFLICLASNCYDGLLDHFDTMLYFR